MFEIDSECCPELPIYDYNTWNLQDSTVEHNNLLFTDFFRKFMIKNLPCVIKNVAQDWKCTKTWVENDQINYDYLIEKYGDLEAPVADCTNIQYNSHCKTDMKVLRFMEYLKNVNYSKILYLKDWHLRHLRPDDHFYNTPSYFALDWLNEFAIDKKEDDFMFVYIGPKGSWTPIHEDVYCSYSWSVNIVGRKEWILFPPGEEQKLKDKFGNLPLTFNAENYNNVRYFRIKQEKGDAIFVPSGWHHQVVNKLNTISVNHNWINACNLHFVWQALQKSLRLVEHQINEFKDTPDFHLQCQLMLKSFFGMDFEIFIKFLCYIANKRLNQLNGESRACLGNYYLSDNTIKFDLKHILNVMHSIQSHPVFLKKDIPVSLKNDFIQSQTNLAHVLNLQAPRNQPQ